MKAAFTLHWRLYIMEALGLAIFMVSACGFGALLESPFSALHHALPDAFVRNVIMGLLMGSTALFIFYSPFTRHSGAHINPAVTLVYLRLGQINKWDALFYILFQFAGGTLAVYLMAVLMGSMLTAPPVMFAVTIPAHNASSAFVTEVAIAFIMMTMILYTSFHAKLSKYTRDIAACMVCLYVIMAGPVSGFGMNPARSFASALPANNWTAWWIYMLAPPASMLVAAECFLKYNREREKK